MSPYQDPCAAPPPACGCCEKQNVGCACSLETEELGDPAMIANGDYIESQFIDQGLMGTRTGRGYYTYPDPAYQAPGFIAVPDMADLDALTAKAMAGARVPQ